MSYLESVDIPTWARGLEGKKIDRVLARQVQDLTALTIIFKGGKLLDLMVGSRACEHCGQTTMVPIFSEPSNVLPFPRKKSGRAASPALHPPAFGPEPPISAYEGDPEALGLTDTEAVDESQYDEELHLGQYAPRVVQPQAVEGTPAISTSKRKITRSQLTAKLHSMSQEEVLHFMATEGPNLEVVDG